MKKFAIASHHHNFWSTMLDRDGSRCALFWRFLKQNVHLVKAFHFQSQIQHVPWHGRLTLPSLDLWYWPCLSCFLYSRWSFVRWQECQLLAGVWLLGRSLCTGRMILWKKGRRSKARTEWAWSWIKTHALGIGYNYMNLFTGMNRNQPDKTRTILDRDFTSRKEIVNILKA